MFSVQKFPVITLNLSAGNSLCLFVKFSLVKQNSKPITEIIQMKILFLPELARELKHKWNFPLDWLR